MNLFNFSLKTVKSQPGKAIKLNVFSPDDMQIGELKVALLQNDTHKLEVYVKYIPYENAEGMRIGKLKFANMKDYEETMAKIEISIANNSKNYFQAKASKQLVSDWITDGEIDFSNFSDIFFIRNEFVIKVLGDNWFGITLSNNEDYAEKLKAALTEETEFLAEEKKRKEQEELENLRKMLTGIFAN